jgi:hypothetical protein
MCPEITNSAPYKIDIITLDASVLVWLLKFASFPFTVMQSISLVNYRSFQAEYICFPSVGFVDRNFFIMYYPAMCDVAGLVLPRDTQ